MASSKKSIWWFLAGLVLGGLIGVVAGYVINDLTSKENPEVVEQMREEEQRQDDIDNLLDQLGSQSPDGASNPPTPPANPAGGGDAEENDETQ
jgi:gas vesicle protein